MPTPVPLTASVVIPTYVRADYLRSCLTHLASQSYSIESIVVVDSSPDTRTRELIESEFPTTRYLRNELGAGHTAASRAIGFGAVTTDVVAFADDDTEPAPDWLEKLLAPYADPAVGAVGGRVINGIPGEEDLGNGQIGMLLPNGMLTGNFSAVTDRVIEVDHMLGASMSFRRTALQSVGGIRDYYPGPCLREETDPALRVGRAGWRVLFTPFATVRHNSGPYAKGRRFDLRYVYYGARNHQVLLWSTLGPGDGRLRRSWRGLASHRLREQRSAIGRLYRRESDPIPAIRTILGTTARSAADVAGTLAGTAVGASLWRAESRDGRG